LFSNFNDYVRPDAAGTLVSFPKTERFVDFGRASGIRIGAVASAPAADCNLIELPVSGIYFFQLR
jgi:hypothetical protein